MSATPEGVESIHERLKAKLAPEESVELSVEDTSEEELEAVLVEGDDVSEAEGEEESVEAEPSEVEAQEVEPSEESTDSIELSHIAEYLGTAEDQLTVNDDGDLMVRTKIDGQEGQAKFSDLLKSYQLEGHLNKQSTELAESQKALQTKLSEADGQLAQKVQQLEDLSQLAYNELLTDYNKVNWDELRTDDPGEFSAKQTDFQNRQNQIASLYQKAVDQRSELTATDSQVSQEKISEETAKLVKTFPSWSDNAVQSKEWAEIGEYAITQGMTAESYAKNVDSSIVIAFSKAKQFDALQKKSTKVTKLVKKVPKIAKPGSTASKIPNAQARTDKLRKQLKRDGGGKALHELLLAKV